MVVTSLCIMVIVFSPFIRKLINKFDFEALDVKMEKSKVGWSVRTSCRVYWH